MTVRISNRHGVFLNVRKGLGAEVTVVTVYVYSLDKKYKRARHIRPQPRARRTADPIVGGKTVTTVTTVTKSLLSMIHVMTVIGHCDG